MEAPAFTEQVVELWSDEEYSEFQHFLAANPDFGDVIPGLGGLRKVRWSVKGRGKRGGARVIYLLLLEPELFYLFYAYTKGDVTDLNSDQKKRLREAVAGIKERFEP